MCRAYFYHIRDIRRISKGLPLALAEQTSVALVTSKLEYCNSLLHNIQENYSVSKIIWPGWDIRRISKGLPLALAEQTSVALVTSKLEYCNSLLHTIQENYSVSKIIWPGWGPSL